jgi:hypothetical protein
VPGWKAYFRLAQTPKIMHELDEWLRHRLRAVRLKQWRGGPTMFRELRALGASTHVAKRIAGNADRWWHNSRLVSTASCRWPTSTVSESRDSPDLNFSNRPVQTRMPGGAGGDRSALIGLYPNCAGASCRRQGIGERAIRKTLPRFVPKALRGQVGGAA